MGRIEFPFLLPPPFSSCYILVVDNKRANVSNYYDNNDDATIRVPISGGRRVNRTTHPLP